MTVLEVSGIFASHGQLDAVHDVSFSLKSGKILFLVGANGAGKTTLLRSIAGDHPIKYGNVKLVDEDISNQPANYRARAGLSLVPEGRRLIPSMTVYENLVLGSSTKRKGNWSIETVYEIFPNLSKLDRIQAGNLSGGEQQAVAIGRSLIGSPIVMLIDEISLGLSPAIVDRVYDVLKHLRDTGLAMLVVEQDLARAIDYADYLIVMCEGRVTLESKPEETSFEELASASFGHKISTEP